MKGILFIGFLGCACHRVPVRNGEVRKCSRPSNLGRAGQHLDLRNYSPPSGVARPCLAWIFLTNLVSARKIWIGTQIDTWGTRSLLPKGETPTWWANLRCIGYGVSEFSVTGIDAVIDQKNPLAFPIKLESNRDKFSFKMRAEAVPEPSEIAGIITSAAFFSGLVFKRKRKLEDDSVIWE